MEKLKQEINVLFQAKIITKKESKGTTKTMEYLLQFDKMEVKKDKIIITRKDTEVIVLFEDITYISKFIIISKDYVENSKIEYSGYNCLQCEKFDLQYNSNDRIVPCNAFPCTIEGKCPGFRQKKLDTECTMNRIGTEESYTKMDGPQEKASNHTKNNVPK